MSEAPCSGGSAPAALLPPMVSPRYCRAAWSGERGVSHARPAAARPSCASVLESMPAPVADP
eukprot:10845228-Heterocapsa_arctica.AAC.1